MTPLLRSSPYVLREHRDQQIDKHHEQREQKVPQK